MREQQWPAAVADHHGGMARNGCVRMPRRRGAREGSSAMLFSESRRERLPGTGPGLRLLSGFLLLVLVTCPTGASHASALPGAGDPGGAAGFLLRGELPLAPPALRLDLPSATLEQGLYLVAQAERPAPEAALVAPVSPPRSRTGAGSRATRVISSGTSSSGSRSSTFRRRASRTGARRAEAYDSASGRTTSPTPSGTKTSGGSTTSSTRTGARPTTSTPGGAESAGGARSGTPSSAPASTSSAPRPSRNRHPSRTSS